ncbi:MAG: hypothetical protein KDE03_13590 [Rhodobacteraceae bacterium]|nr:hypothetical protein [Paracoccaceae bacterium]
MSDLSNRFVLETGPHQLSLDPIDVENYAVIVEGDYEASFPGYRLAHEAAVRRVKENNQFSPEELKIVSDLSNWQTETIDLFDPEEE